MSIDTRTPAEIAYDATRLSPIAADVEAAYEQQVADVARQIGTILCELSAEEEEILNALIELSEPDPEELDDRIAIAQEVDRAIEAERRAAADPLTPDPDIDQIIAALEAIEQRVDARRRRRRTA